MRPPTAKNHPQQDDCEIELPNVPGHGGIRSGQSTIYANTNKKHPHALMFGWLGRDVARPKLQGQANDLTS